MNLTLNHPVSSLVWYISEASNQLASLQYKNAKIVIDGRDRFSMRPGDYFQKYQLYKHFNGVNLLKDNLHYNAYSFAINAWDCKQPSGSCNFSRIDNSQLIIEEGIAQSGGTPKSSGTLTLHARNYNVLRIASGMGGLAYSN